MKMREFRIVMAIGELITRIIEAISGLVDKSEERKEKERQRLYKKVIGLEPDHEPESGDNSNDKTIR